MTNTQEWLTYSPTCGWNIVETECLHFKSKQDHGPHQVVQNFLDSSPQNDATVLAPRVEHD